MTSLQFFCPRWGSEALPWSEFISRVIDAGYDGIEWAIGADTTGNLLDQVWSLAEKRGIAILPQHYDTNEADLSLHLDRYAAWLERILSYPAPKINSQTGKDYFSFLENLALIEMAQRMAENGNQLICHETHRNKFSFAAHITKRFLNELPSLSLTLDISHWVCVAESYLADQQEAVALAISRSQHLHARVGHPEAPQVTDPRLPEWEEALAHHLTWWKSVAQAADAEGRTLTISPEFGPYPYLVELPFTRQPITSQWEINRWMMSYLKENLLK